MAELIYSVRDIFNKKTADGCLTQHNAEKYLIPTYQRGYKWASDEHGAVIILLNDLKKAFDAKKKEYYLQYITVKETKSGTETFLELIDGQQRLTTLSIFIAVATQIINCDDIANNLLNYEVRGDFFQDSIHNRENLPKFLSAEWSNETGFLNNNSQDTFYIISAAKKINSFITEHFEESTRKEFANFVFDKVKIIVNVIDRGDSERVFSNLNSNKVNLTEAELIKGILLTKVSRGDDKQKRFREITEERMKLGLQWDEMARWCNSPEVRMFYFNNASDGMTELMKFAACRTGANIDEIEKQDAKDYPLFNFYLERADHKESHETIVSSYRILKDLYEDTEFYNMLGYLMHVKGTQLKSCTEFLQVKDSPLNAYLKGDKRKSDLKSDLLNLIKDKLKIEKDFEQLAYGEDDVTIHQILLALSAFDPQDNTLSRIRFDFYSFKGNKWTLEHIFPQTPEGKGQTFSTNEIGEIKKMIEGIQDTVLRKKVEEILDNGYSIDTTVANAQKEKVKTALDMVVNNIGNMCLLSSKDNPSNGNKFFDEKRSNILQRITMGSFVPKHTFEVFSKSIFPDNPGDLNLWNKSDMDKHIEIMRNRIEAINNFKY